MEKKIMLRLYAYQTKAKDPGNTVVAKNPVMTTTSNNLLIENVLTFMPIKK